MLPPGPTVWVASLGVTLLQGVCRDRGRKAFASSNFHAHIGLRALGIVDKTSQVGPNDDQKPRAMLSVVVRMQREADMPPESLQSIIRTLCDRKVCPCD